MSDPTQDSKILNAQRILGYQFSNLLELRRALGGDGLLALLGDNLINQVIIREGIRRHAAPGQYQISRTSRCENTRLTTRLPL